MNTTRPLNTEENPFKAQYMTFAVHLLVNNTSVCHKAHEDMESSACAGLVVVTDLDFE